MYIKLINLDTGDLLEVDSSNLIDKGIPEGYRDVSTITEEEWINALQKSFK